jgi:Cof subfamily protein (haloacid dehalogenase superfamily)
MDLDGTLLRSDMTISRKTRHIIKKASAKGVRLVFASGRVPVSMHNFARDLGMNTGLLSDAPRPNNYFISNHGALITDARSGRVVWEARLPAKSALSVVELANAEGFSVQIHEGDKLYLSRATEYSHYTEGRTGLKQEVISDLADFVAQCRYGLRIPGEPAMLEGLYSLLQTYLGDEISIYTGQASVLEIGPLGVDKGSALERIAGLEGISQAETMAIGDSKNDEEMIRWAGLGVALANAGEGLKKIARIVSDRSNDEDGVADVVKHWVLKENKNI